MNTELQNFNRFVASIGTFRLRPLTIPNDIDLIHRWVSLDYARYWGMQGFSLQRVEEEYRKICEQASVYLGYCNETPAFLLECYDPRLDPVGEHYAPQPGDLGMHILVAPAVRPIPNFTRAVFSVIMDFMFSDPAVQRVIVEPDINNTKIHALNRWAGFEYRKIIELPGKQAHLAFCTREQFRCALDKASKPEELVSHLQPDLWTRANKHHLRKAISEFAHESLIEPELLEHKGDWGCYRVSTDMPGIEYRFRARVLSLEHWHIDPDSLEKFVNGEPAEPDSLSFIVEIRNRLGIAPAMLPTYMEEISSTLYSSAFKHAKTGVDVPALLHADFQTLETAMMEGHPAFLANNGRIGFDAADYHAYAPEAASPVRLIWLAAHKSKAEFSCTEDLSYPQLMEQELGAKALEKFSLLLERQGLAPDDYWFMPVHPWQWYNKLAVVFAADIAASELVCLGYGDDRYLAQQSIRTFFNTSHPHKRYVKTALSILNMGFMRGLSPYYMSTTPAINDCINDLIEQDPYLSEKRFSILREVAAVGYRNRHYEEAADKHSPYRKMLAALWRESPVPGLQPGQRLMTMAALLHVDARGTALLPELIKASGIDTEAWLRRYLDCYLSPLLHCFYTYDLVFMPHGENLILVLENHVPVRAIMKDIAEEAAIMNKDLVLSEKVQRLAVYVPEELKILSIFTDFFDLIFRYLAHILFSHDNYPEKKFWRLVADCILAYQRSHPELADKFARHDLFAPEFIRSCLNRLQLGNPQQMIDLADPAKNLKFVGTLKNPIAEFRPEAMRHESEEACT
ncbi:GNAT family N-acetyltransferase [Methylotuvimicrobium sp.]|uniref:GNAT family N-acetyltransferase n=1 Tax=Methylotuvimicrobium sp. TaxID=2822413 RepID=UPI003D64DF0B